MDTDAFRLAACEFPCDNPGLSHGAAWICRSLTGMPRAIVRAAGGPRRTDPPLSEPGWPQTEAPIERSDTIPSAAPTEPAPSPPPSQPDAFSELLVIAKAILRSRGHAAEHAVDAVFLQGSLEGIADGARAALVQLGHLRAGEAEIAAQTRALLAGWRSALDGSGDLAACGDTTLDGLCAELLAGIEGRPGARDELRRALRTRGVAAFGLLSLAA